MKIKTKKKLKKTKKVSIYTQIYNYFISLFSNSKEELDSDLVDIDTD